MATVEQIERKTLGKVRPHQTQNEGLVFEKSAPGKRGLQATAAGCAGSGCQGVLGAAYRKTRPGSCRS